MRSQRSFAPSERGKRSMADHVRSYILSAFSWGLKSEHDYRSTAARRFRLTYNPAAGIPTEPKTIGTRWLSEEGFVRLYRWLECPDTPVHPSYARAVQIIMLTGQRVEEIAVCMSINGRRGTDYRLDQDQKPSAARCSGALVGCRTDRVDYPERTWLVLPLRQRPVEARQPRHTLQLHLAPAGSRVIPHATNRDLRRTFKTLAGKAGVPKRS